MIASGKAKFILKHGIIHKTCFSKHANPELSESIMDVYIITNLINNKKYVGITNNYKARWKYHRRNRVETSKEYHKVLYKAFRKYGFDNFSFELVKQALSEEEGKTLEIQLIKDLKTLSHEHGYNVTEGGDHTGQKGERNRNATLTEEQAKDIIARRESKELFTSVYEDYKHLLKRSGMESIWLGTSWKYLQPETITKLHAGRKVTDNQILEIKSLISESDLSYKEIGKLFDVSAALITRIKQNKIHADVS
jgi:group I intron endonuclease